MQFDSYRYRVVVEWMDPDDGQPQLTEFEAHQLSAGRAGRLMSTQPDGVSYNFSHFTSVRIERIKE
ncbi:hypothetical protein QO010_002074 [Caulobacter ginsengisoli]|uniref:Uncharacterized protein n=1 Tax=Caulobacter ginsengisoli TaxID=400775 RepID=A0ABU0IT02_9CAUL|nr:hypothetical protein [Caulobacter ginsengisoli]MDQ0464293.1 hypothetical protein [Caulobacter ginsengisoli]